ncbi:MAG: hypothetical protein CYPHOPRED_004884 [Cyphobasidiales sp. Tagirdzhanova-0007]|nr:MAG: hypothetical protein CYPHOPRED_004884 [Cyphobasidiales sp. Tagirdzhanova-0007]
MALSSSSDSIEKTVNPNAIRAVLATPSGKIVNNAPHLGNLIGSTMSADVFARYNRTRNRRTLYICGTDEYGTTTENRALKEGVSPRELCDKYHLIHKNSYDWFELDFDYFGRTSTPQQTEICQEIFLKLYRNGHLVEQVVAQLYCEKDQRFLADRYVEGTCPKCGYEDARGDQCDSCTNPLNPIELIKPRCVLCSTRPVTRETSHLSIALDRLQEEIAEWVDRSSAKGKWSTNTMAMTKSWLKEGLLPRNVTRDLAWGVPVPLKGWEDKVMYVWFDAPIGYPSITACYTDDWEQWWRDPENVTLYQFMGKDNVPFHTLFFPGYLLGTKEPWTMLTSISTTEYLQYEGTKFSKSRGIGVFGENAKDTGIPPSVWRYFLISNRPETSDSQFTWKNFIASNNAELLNNLGNFVNRVIKFVNAKYESVLSEGESPEAEGEGEKALRKDVDKILVEYVDAMEDMRLRYGLELVMRLSARGNQYLQSSDFSNTLFADNPARCASVVLLATNLIYLLSVLVHPFMPSTEAGILRQVNAPARSVPTSFTGKDLQHGHRLGQAEYLFTRIKPEMESVWRQQFGDKDTAAAGEEPSKKSKKKAASKQAKNEEKPAYTGPKTEELIAKEKEVVDQGAKVRDVKAGKSEGEVARERTGFDATSPDALAELEDKVLLLIGGLAHLAQEYADLARRTRPSPEDMLAACDDGGIPLRGLVNALKSNAEAGGEGINDLILPPAQSESATTVLFDPVKRFLTDSHDDTTRLASYAPSFLPFLPPSHSYKQTPVYPCIATPSQAQAAGIRLPGTDASFAGNKQERTMEKSFEGTTADKRMSQLDARIRTTRLVEASLQNLIRATSKANQQPDAIVEEEPFVEGQEIVCKQPKDDIGVLLKRYERDAAICNFEREAQSQCLARR